MMASSSNPNQSSYSKISQPTSNKGSFYTPNHHRSSTSSPTSGQYQKFKNRTSLQASNQPMVPSFTQEPVLGSIRSTSKFSPGDISSPSSSNSVSTSLRISYSSIASACIPSTGIKSTIDQAEQVGHESKSAVAQNQFLNASYQHQDFSSPSSRSQPVLSLDLLPPRTQSAPPDIQEQYLPMPRASTSTSITESMSALTRESKQDISSPPVELKQFNPNELVTNSIDKLTSQVASSLFISPQVPTSTGPNQISASIASSQVTASTTLSLSEQLNKNDRDSDQIISSTVNTISTNTYSNLSTPRRKLSTPSGDIIGANILHNSHYPFHPHPLYYQQPGHHMIIPQSNSPMMYSNNSTFPRSRSNISSQLHSASVVSTTGSNVSSISANIPNQSTITQSAPGITTIPYSNPLQAPQLYYASPHHPISSAYTLTGYLPNATPIYSMTPSSSTPIDPISGDTRHSVDSTVSNINLQYQGRHNSAYRPSSTLTSISTPIMKITPPVKKIITIKHPETREEIVFKKPNILQSTTENIESMPPSVKKIDNDQILIKTHSEISSLSMGIIEPDQITSIKPIPSPFSTTENLISSLEKIHISPTIVEKHDKRDFSKEKLDQAQTILSLNETTLNISEKSVEVEEPSIINQHQDNDQIETTMYPKESKIVTECVLDTRRYSKELLYSMLASRKFFSSSTPTLEAAIKDFFDLLGRPVPHHRTSSSSARNNISEDHRRSPHSISKQLAPPGYDSGYSSSGTPPPGFFSKPSRSDGRVGRESSIQRNKSSSMLITRRAISPQSVLIPTEGRWVRPSSDISSESETVIRSVKGILNKIAPDNFDRLSGQLINILMDPLKCLRQSYPKVIDALKTGQEPDWSPSEEHARSLLTTTIGVFFDKAVDEPHFAPLYAGLCRTIADCSKLPEYPVAKITVSEGISTTSFAPVSMFRMALLNQCKAEYEKKIAWSSSTSTVLPDQSSDIESSEDAEFIRLKTKRRVLGNIAFIGHLYKQGLLREEIIYNLIADMLNNVENKEDDEIECCIQMINSTGSKLDLSSPTRMDPFFNKLRILLDSGHFSNRINFAVMDLIDLRIANWNKNFSSTVATGSSSKINSYTSSVSTGSVSTPSFSGSSRQSVLSTLGRKKRELNSCTSPSPIISGASQFRPIVSRSSSHSVDISSTNSNNSLTKISPGFYSKQTQQTLVNKFGLLSEEIDDQFDDPEMHDQDNQNVVSLKDQTHLEYNAEEMVTNMNFDNESQSSAFSTIIKSVIYEDPSHVDLISMGQESIQILSSFPFLISKILVLTFDAKEAVQLRLCSFLSNYVFSQPPSVLQVGSKIMDNLMNHLVETFISNFDQWVEDVPKLSSNVGRLFGSIMKCLLLDDTLELIKSHFGNISDALPSYQALLFIGSFLHYLCKPLSFDQIRQSIKFCGIDSPNDSENLNLFAIKHNISLMPINNSND